MKLRKLQMSQRHCVTVSQREWALEARLLDSLRLNYSSREIKLLNAWARKAGRFWLKMAMRARNKQRWEEVRKGVRICYFLGQMLKSKIIENNLEKVLFCMDIFCNFAV